MWFETKYDNAEVECQFCHKKAKPIIKRNPMKFGLGGAPGVIGRVGPSSANKPNRYILICPSCKALIGFKK